VIRAQQQREKEINQIKAPLRNSGKDKIRERGEGGKTGKVKRCGRGASSEGRWESGRRAPRVGSLSEGKGWYRLSKKKRRDGLEMERARRFCINQAFPHQ